VNWSNSGFISVGEPPLGESDLLLRLWPILGKHRRFLVCLSGIPSTPQDAFGAVLLTAQRGAHKSGQVKQWEGPLEIVSPANGAAIRFALGYGDKRENGDRF
jgi:hypothetical protein